MSQASVCNDTVAQVVISETVVLSEKSEHMLRGQLRSQMGMGDYIFVPDRDNLAKRGMVAATSIHKLHSNNQAYIMIRVANPGREKTLYRGTQLGIVESFRQPDYSDTICTMDNKERVKSPHIIDGIITAHEEHLSTEEINTLTNLLKQFSGIFSTSSTDLGNAEGYSHRIDTGPCPPIAQSPRRIDMHVEEEVEKLVEGLKDKGIIEPCHSPWNSPIVVVRKKCGAIRMCIDYRRLNAISKRPIYPIPDSKQLFDCVGGATYFSTLDLSMGYYQIPLDNLDTNKTAFTTKSGQYQFTRMPFGLSGAPATFQRVMSDILREFNWKSCVIYLDDVLVFGNTLDEHNQRLAAVFNRFLQAGLKLSPSKCNFMRKEVKYLGHVMNSQGVATDPEKIEAIRSWPKPTSNSELHTFVGLCGYYRRFIKEFATIIRPLEDLLRKSSGKAGTFEWSSTQDISFSLLKTKLSEAPILSYPNKTDTFILDTDACHSSIGAVLSQMQNGVERVISYASNQLTKTERSYCTTRKELLAVIRYVRQFRHYLIGKQFILRTDHRALIWMLSWEKANTSQFCTWKAELAEFDFIIEHRPGQKHTNADALSRRPCGQCELDHVDPKPKRNVKTLEVDDVVNEVDTKVEPVEIIIKMMRNNGWQEKTLPRSCQNQETISIWKLRESLRIRGDKLYLVNEQEKYLEIPMLSERLDIIKKLHQDTAHSGSDKCIAILKQFYYWPKLDLDVKLHISRCISCATHKSCNTRYKNKGTLSSRCPFQTISIDITEMPRVSREGYRYILGVIDNFSRYPMLIPLKETSSTTIAKALIGKWFSIFGIPGCIHSDNGTNFRSKIILALCSILHIRKSFATPYYPQGDGIVERLFGTAKPMIRILSDEKCIDWPDTLPFVEMGLRTTNHSSIGFSPAEVIFGKAIDNIFLSRAGETAIKLYDSCGEYINQILEQAREIHSCIQAKQPEGASHEPEFQPGDLVMVKRTPNDKAAPGPYRGPYKVVARVGDFAYRLMDEEKGGVILRNRRLLKRFLGEVEREQDRHTSIATQRSTTTESTTSATGSPNDQLPPAIPTRQYSAEGVNRQRYPRRHRKCVNRYQ